MSRFTRRNVLWGGVALAALVAAGGIVASIGLDTDDPTATAIGRVASYRADEGYRYPTGFSVAAGRSAMVASAKHEDGRGITLTRFRSEGDALVVDAPERLRSSRILHAIPTMELPDGDWLIAANGCDSAFEECGLPPMEVHRLTLDGGLEHVVDLNLEYLQFVGYAEDEQAVIRFSRRLPDGSTEGPFFQTLSAASGDVADIAMPPLPGRDGPPIDEQFSSSRHACAASSRLWILDTYHEPGGPQVAALSSVDMTSGSITAPAMVEPGEGLLPFQVLCNPDGGGWVMSGREDAHLAASRFDAVGALDAPTLSPVAVENAGQSGSPPCCSYVWPVVREDEIVDAGDPVKLLLLEDGAWRELDPHIAGAVVVRTGDGSGMVAIADAIYPVAP
jgi:hypothetical protein